MASLKEKISYNSTTLNGEKKKCWLHIPKGTRLLSRKKRRCKIVSKEENGSIQKFTLKVLEQQEKGGMEWEWTIGAEVTVWDITSSPIPLR